MKGFGDRGKEAQHVQQSDMRKDSTRDCMNMRFSEERQWVWKGRRVEK